MKSETKTKVEYCDKCGRTEVPGFPDDICPACLEAAKKTEVDEILKKNGVTRDQVTTEPVVTEAAPPEPVDDDIPIRTNGNGSKAAAEPVKDEPKAAPSYVYEDPGPNWVDALGDAYKIAREDADAAAPEFIDFPTSLIRSVVRESNQITKRDVESVLAEFSMNVSLGQYQDESMALVVSDISDKAGMKKARELRLVGKRERVRFDQQGVEIKEPYLRRTQLIDGLRRAVRTKFEACEAHLLEQEQFEDRENARIAAELQTTRIADLAQFEWLTELPEIERAGAATALKIGYMNDAEWSAFRSTVETEYLEKKEQERIAAEKRKAEEERLQIENARLQKVDARVAELSKLGLNYDGEQFTLGDIAVAKADIEHATDEAFARLITKLEPAVVAAKEAADLADQEKARLQREADESKAELKRIEDQKQAEAERLAAEAEAARLAPDKDKLHLYFTAVHDATTPQPEVESGEAKALLNAFCDEVATVVNKYSAAAARIGSKK